MGNSNNGHVPNILTLAQFNALPDETKIYSKHGNYWSDEGDCIAPKLANALRDFGIGLVKTGYVGSHNSFYIFEKATVPPSYMDRIAGLLMVIEALPKAKSVKSFTEMLEPLGIRVERAQVFDCGSHWGGDQFARALLLNGVQMKYYRAENFKRNVLIPAMRKRFNVLAGQGLDGSASNGRS